MMYEPNLQILWDYLSLHQNVEKSDVIVGFCCYDDNVTRLTAEPYHQGYAPKILLTGGLGRNTTGLFKQSEAANFAWGAVELGVPEEAWDAYHHLVGMGYGNNWQNKKRRAAEPERYYSLISASYVTKT